ncbi:MAG: V-type ATP synthase subunit F [Methylobacter sp.]|jgi:vacuolar-type H+-ATPase subunit F/Vma7|nr:V-type ATP synthase subunit F [Methylobacter sp.]
MSIPNLREVNRLSETRLIAMGGAALIEGFSLLGFETYPEATPQILDAVLKELVQNQQKALVILEEKLARSGTALLHQVRSEGGRIVVIEVPPLQAPEDYHPLVEDLIRRVLGPSALEESP